MSRESKTSQQLDRIDYAHTALYLLVWSITAEHVERKIDTLLLAAKFMEKGFREMGRVDLIKGTSEIIEELLALKLVNWRWFEVYSKALQMPPGVEEYLKELFKKKAEIDVIFVTLLDMLLDAGVFLTREDLVEPVTIGKGGD